MNKLNLISTLLFLILLLTIIQSCDNPAEPIFETTASHFLLPAKKGNYWEYKSIIPDIGSVDSALIYRNYSSFGRLFDSSTSTRDFKWEIIDSIDIKINNVIYPSYVFDFF